MEASTPEIPSELEQEAMEEFQAMHPEVDNAMDVHKAQLQANVSKKIVLPVHVVCNLNLQGLLCSLLMCAKTNYR